MNKQEWLITIIIFIIISLMFAYGRIAPANEVSILDEYPPSSETLV